jgi:hypothetical protein
MKSKDIIQRIDEMLSTKRLQQDLAELEQLRKQTNNPMGLQVIFEDHAITGVQDRYVVRLTINGQQFESWFHSEKDRQKNHACVKKALNKVINNAVTDLLLDDAHVASLFQTHFKKH